MEWFIESAPFWVDLIGLDVWIGCTLFCWIGILHFAWSCITAFKTITIFDCLWFPLAIVACTVPPINLVCAVFALFVYIVPWLGRIGEIPVYRFK